MKKLLVSLLAVLALATPSQAANRATAAGRTTATRADAVSRGTVTRGLYTTALYNRSAIAPALNAMATTRVDFVGIGDSNEAFFGFGWGWGVERALSLRRGSYATGLTAQNAFGTGTYQYFLSREMGAITGAPANLDAYMNMGLGTMFPHHYAYVASSYAPFFANANHLELPSFGPLDVTKNLVFSLNYGTFTTGSGTFTPGISNGLGGSVIKSGSATNTNTGAFSMQRLDTQLATDATRAGATLCFATSAIGGTNVTGPYFGTFYRVTDPNVTAGAAYSILDNRGGKTLTDMSYDFLQASDAYLTHFYSEIRRQQGSTKYVVHWVNSGTNDQNDSTNLSNGPNPAITSTNAGFQDNLQAIFNRVTAIWIQNGWPTSELYWIVMPTHPAGPPDSAALIGYRTVAAVAFANANPQVCVVDLAKHGTPQMYSKYQWYYPSTTGHLAQEGYNAVGLAIVDDLLTP